MFPPPRPIIGILEGEQLDAIDAQHTATKEVQRKRATMEEIKRLERELVEAKERNQRCNLRWHNQVRAEQLKVEQLEKDMARIACLGRIANKPTTTGRYEREIDLDEQNVSGNEVELVFLTSKTRCKGETNPHLEQMGETSNGG